MDRSVTVVFEGVSESECDPDLLRDGLARLTSMAGDARCVVVIGADFGASVSRHGGPASYRAGRPAGLAVGKTIRGGDGAPVVVIDAGAVTGDGRFDPSGTSYLFAHEGGHVGLLARGEDREAIGAVMPPSTSAQVFVNLAAEAIEEFRIDRALPAEGFGRGSHLDSLNDTADQLEAVTRTARRSGLTDDSLRTLSGLFSELTVAAGFVAAELVSAGNGDLPKAPSWLRERWPLVARALASVPSSRQPHGNEQARRVVAELAALFAGWLTDLGMGLRDTPGGIVWTAVGGETRPSV